MKVREVYTVMADNGLGEFLWHKEDESPSPKFGSIFYSLADEIKPNFEDDIDDLNLVMSLYLFRDFCRWVRWYLDSTDNIFEPPNINWEEFNEEGLRLALLLKIELGNSKQVVYAKTSDDPTNDKESFVEILLPDQV